jgi:hypothetical protein
MDVRGSRCFQMWFGASRVRRNRHGISIDRAPGGQYYNRRLPRPGRLIHYNQAIIGIISQAVATRRSAIIVTVMLVLQSYVVRRRLSELEREKKMGSKIAGSRALPECGLAFLGN